MSTEFKTLGQDFQNGFSKISFNFPDAFHQSLDINEIGIPNISFQTCRKTLFIAVEYLLIGLL